MTLTRRLALLERSTSDGSGFDLFVPFALKATMDEECEGLPTAAEKAQLAAARTLAVVRKLLAPSIHVGPVTQMNVSNRAVNLVGPAPVAENSDHGRRAVGMTPELPQFATP